MNDLTKEAARRDAMEARKQAFEEATRQVYRPGLCELNLGMSSAHYGNALAQSNIDQSYGRPKYGNDYLEPDRPLTVKPEHYLTGLEGSRCEVIKHYAPMTFKWQETGLDINEFRKFCEEIGE